MGVDVFLNGKQIIQVAGTEGATLEEVAAAALTDFPNEFINGYQLTWIDADTIEISSGFARDSNDDLNLALDSSIQIELSNDLDTGSEAADTWYAVHVIGDTEEVNPTTAIFSASETPTLPSGYDVFRRVGWVKNNASSDILSFEQIGRGSSRTFWWNQENTLTRVLTSGQDLTFTDVDASAYVSPSSNQFIALLSFKTGSGGGSQSDNKVHIRGNASSIANSLTIYSSGEKTTDFMNDNITIRCDDNQIFEYRVDSSSNEATIAVAAYLDVL